MDGLSEDSPFLWLVVAFDFFDRVRQSLSPAAAFAIVFYYGLAGSKLDVWLLLVFVGWHRCQTILSWILASTDATHSAIFVATSFAIIVSYNIVSRSGSLSVAGSSMESRAVLIPARTTHTRFFPERHSFSYPYLVAGIPVEPLGKLNGMISVWTPWSTKLVLPSNWNSRSWFHVDPDDHLQRGYTNEGLRGKLDRYLETEDADASQYPHAFLVTAPKFLGRQFRPVSFWFLYSEDMTLSAIVMEVNNVFGERRPYLVARDFEAEARRVKPGNSVSSDHKDEGPDRFQSAWKKDFHFSPFNSRKGSYSLLAHDPLSTGMKGFRGLDITVSLISSKGHPKLVARLFSEGEAIDPSQASLLARIKFILSWFWVGLATFPRFLRESAVLFFGRKLHVWFRPEPLKQSMGRQAESTEQQLELVFRQYLQHLVQQSPNSLALKYVPSGIDASCEEVFYGPGAAKAPDSAELMEIRVLTPAFYTRFVHYAHDTEALFCELAESCTVWVDKPDLLPKLFLKKPSQPLHIANPFDFASFQLIKRLRRRPERIKRPLTSADTPPKSPTAKDIRDFRISSMDGFVLGHGDAQLKKTYRSLVVRLFLADHLTFGSLRLLGFLELIIKTSMSLTASALVSKATGTRPRP